MDIERKLDDKLEEFKDELYEEFGDKFSKFATKMFSELEAQEQPKGRWKPEAGDDYFCLSCVGSVLDAAAWDAARDAVAADAARHDEIMAEYRKTFGGDGND